MALSKQGYNIPFGQGLDTKTDPNQVMAGKMLALQNSIFTNGALTKRNGFENLTVLPTSAGSTTLTTLNGTLLATGSNLYAYSSETNQWINRGLVQPVDLNVQPLVRNSQSQSAADTAVSSSGIACSVYMSGSALYYQINDAVTGQIIIPQVALPDTAVNGRVAILGRFFVITFLATVSASPHLQYISIPINTPTAPTPAVDLSTQVSGLNAGYDILSANNTLYYSWDGSDGGGAIRTARMTSTFIQSAPIVTAGHTADLISIAADESHSTAVIWITFWDTANGNGFSMAKSQTLVSILAPTQIITNMQFASITSVATNMVLTVFYEINQDYGYASIRTDYIASLTVTQAGSVSGASVVLRSVGLASKAFYYNDTIYMLAAYGQSFQPTYFLIDSNSNVIAKIAYSNGGGYVTNQILPQVNVVGTDIYVAYLFKDFLVSVSKDLNAVSVGGIYSQTGVNLANIQINITGQLSAEIASCLQLTGGIVWQYDAVKPVELGFNVWPEDVQVTTSSMSGNLADQEYFYQFTYEWTDAQGNLHRSAPSIPFSITTSGGGTSTNTIDVPTLRITYKTGNNVVRIVGYRWSTAQQVFYQFTSVTSPILNDTTVDSVEFTDTAADADILGNTIIYTTGGVLEDIAPPPSSGSTMFRSRLWVIDAEDRNLLWYSKQVIESTPVEFSDLLTLYIAPSASSQGVGTGPATCLSAMDDKLIIFKRSAIYYVTGNGPDNTGANNDFIDPTFITSTVGCSNPDSIVFMPNGIMFQSDKGIWLLGRDLSTQYIGAGVEAYNSAIIESALTVPGTNQVRFTLSTGVVLMYDYYYNQWGTFTNIPAISSTLFENMHTYLNSEGQVRQETVGSYMDGSNPVLLSYSTAWLKLTNLQGFQRAHFFYFLGKFISAHRLNVQIAYDYDPGIVQQFIITPEQTATVYGDPIGQYYGTGVYGGTSSREQWRCFFQRQKCQSVQITMSEVYDASLGPIGAGFSMSGLNLVFAGKASYPKLNPTNSAG
jgi:hypothetical protein